MAVIGSTAAVGTATGAVIGGTLGLGWWSTIGMIGMGIAGVATAGTVFIVAGAAVAVGTATGAELPEMTLLSKGILEDVGDALHHGYDMSSYEA